MDNAIQDSSSVLDEQSSQVGDDSMSPEAAERGRETTCCGSSQSEVQETAANENIYSEIPSSSQFGGDGAAMHRKSENTYSEVRSMRDPSKGTCVGLAGLLDEASVGAGVPPEETLYEQPVC